MSTKTLIARLMRKKYFSMKDGAALSSGNFLSGWPAFKSQFVSFLVSTNKMNSRWVEVGSHV